MKKNRSLIIVLIILTILIIIVTLLILILLPKLREEKFKNIDAEVSYEDILDIQEEKTYKAYTILSQCIEKYINYNISKDSYKIKLICEEESNEKIMEIENPYYLKIEAVYKIERVNDTTYFTKAMLNNKDVYFLVNVDYENTTFNIRQSNNKEFQNAMNNIVDGKYKKSIIINSNEENKIETKDLSNYIIASNYFDIYKNLAIEKTDIAYELINEETKQTKFSNNIDNYKSYIERNKENIEDASLVSLISVEAQENKKTYTVQDSNGNQYVIEEYLYTNFNISIKDSTQYSQDEIEKYAKMDYKQKLKFNVDKIFSWVNNKEYEVLYSKLNSQFKNTNFNTLEKFQNYIQDKFFDYNYLGTVSMQQQGNTYILRAPYKSGASVAAEEREVTVIMRLENDMNFSFSIAL